MYGLFHSYPILKSLWLYLKISVLFECSTTFLGKGLTTAAVIPSAIISRSFLFWSLCSSKIVPRSMVRKQVLRRKIFIPIRVFDVRSHFPMCTNFPFCATHRTEACSCCFGKQLRTMSAPWPRVAFRKRGSKLRPLVLRMFSSEIYNKHSRLWRSAIILSSRSVSGVVAPKCSLQTNWWVITLLLHLFQIAPLWRQHFFLLALTQGVKILVITITNILVL